MMRFISILLLSLSVMSCTSSSHSKPLEVVAHRGGALLRNENTLSAFEHAIELQCDFIEFDVHLSADSQLVVCHDDKVDRTTNGHGAIEEMTLAQIQHLCIRDFRTGDLTDEHIPSLSEVLELVNHRCRILVEIKRSHPSQYQGIEAKVVKALRDYGSQDEYIVQSFDNRVIETIHYLDSTIRLEKLIFCSLPCGHCFDGRISRFSPSSHPYCQSVNIYHLFASERFIRSIHEQGMKVKVWTVNDWNQVPSKADAVITNRPDIFISEKSESIVQ